MSLKETVRNFCMTKLFITAKPSSKKEGIEKTSESTYIIKVKELAIEGKANKAILKKLSGYLKIPINRLKIVSGLKSRKKVIEII